MAATALLAFDPKAPFSGCALTVIRPPGGVNLIALSSRLTNTRSISSSSTLTGGRSSGISAFSRKRASSANGIPSADRICEHRGHWPHPRLAMMKSCLGAGLKTPR